MRLDLQAVHVDNKRGGKTEAIVAFLVAAVEARRRGGRVRSLRLSPPYPSGQADLPRPPAQGFLRPWRAHVDGSVQVTPLIERRVEPARVPTSCTTLSEVCISLSSSGVQTKRLDDARPGSNGVNGRIHGTSGTTEHQSLNPTGACAMCLLHALLITTRRDPGHDMHDEKMTA